MPKRAAAALNNVTVDKAEFDTIMRALIASPPIRKDDLKPKQQARKAKAKRSRAK